MCGGDGRQIESDARKRGWTRIGSARRLGKRSWVEAGVIKNNWTRKLGFG